MSLPHKGTSEATRPARAERAAAASVTGIRRLDDELGATSPAQHVVFLHAVGPDATAFLMHAACATGRSVVYATTSRSPESFEAERKRMGFASTPVVAVDLREVKDPSQARKDIDDACQVLPDATLAIESLTGLVHAWGEAAAKAWFAALKDAWKGRRLLASLADRAYEPGTRETFLGVDAVVRLARREVLGARHDVFQVVQAGGRAMTPRAFPFRVERPGGIRPHVSKILVTGAYSAGKSTLVHTLSETGVNVEHLGTTVALDHGRIDRDGLTIDLFGTPGQERFDPLIRQIGHGALGVLSVVDSARPSTLHRARTLADEISGGHVPVVYAANKQDAPGALTPEAIRERLGIPAAVPVLACRAHERESAVHVLDALVERVLATLAVPAAATGS